MLPHEVRQSLWKESKLPQRLVRPGLFDYNEFVIKSKETIGAWARDKYPVEVSFLLAGGLYVSGRTTI